MLTQVVKYAAANWERSCRLAVSQGAPFEEAGDVVNDAVVGCCESADREITDVPNYWAVCVRHAANDHNRRQGGAKDKRGRAPLVVDSLVAVEVGDRQASPYGQPENELATSEALRVVAAALIFLTPREHRAIGRQLDGQPSGTGAERAALFCARRRIQELLAC